MWLVLASPPTGHGWPSSSPLSSIPAPEVCPSTLYVMHDDGTDVLEDHERTDREGGLGQAGRRRPSPRRSSNRATERTCSSVFDTEKQAPPVRLETRDDPRSDRLPTPAREPDPVPRLEGRKIRAVRHERRRLECSDARSAGRDRRPRPGPQQCDVFRRWEADLLPALDARIDPAVGDERRRHRSARVQTRNRARLGRLPESLSRWPMGRVLACDRGRPDHPARLGGSGRRDRTDRRDRPGSHRHRDTGCGRPIRRSS